MSYEKYLTGAFYKNGTLWLFIPQHLFYEQASINIKRYNYLISLPKEFKEDTLTFLLNNKTPITLNKWTQEFIVIISNLSYDSMSFRFPLDIHQKKKLWLEFVCFILRLKLRSSSSSWIYNYDIFFKPYDLQIISHNFIEDATLLQHPKYNAEFFSKLITDSFTNATSTEEGFHNIFVETLSHLAVYIKVKKPTLKPAQAIISVLLGLIWLHAYGSFSSIEQVFKYIECNIIAERNRAEFIRQENIGLLSVVYNKKIYLNGYDIMEQIWFDNTSLSQLLKKYYSNSTIKKGLFILPLFELFNDMNDYLSYTYVTTHYVSHRDWIQQGLGALELSLKEASSKAFPSHNTVMELFNRLVNKRMIFHEKYYSIEKKRLTKLKLAISVFLKEFNTFSKLYKLNLTKIETKPLSNFTHAINQKEWESFITRRNPYHVPNARIGSPWSQHPEFITDSNNIYAHHKNKIAGFKYDKEDTTTIGFYTKLLDIGLDEALLHYNDFYEKLYAAICFIYKHLNFNMKFALHKERDITLLICHKIYNICHTHFFEILDKRKNFPLVDEKDTIFSFFDSDQLSHLSHLQQEHRKKDLLYKIFDFSLYKSDNNTLRNVTFSECESYLTNQGVDIYAQCLKRSVEMNPLMPVVKIIAEVINTRRDSRNLDDHIPIHALLFYAIYRHNYGLDLNHYPLNVRENIPKVLSEITYFSDNETVVHILSLNIPKGIPLLTEMQRLANKEACAKLSPIIQDILSLFESYYDTITKEKAEVVISTLILQIVKIVSLYVSFTGIDFIFLCFIKWLLYDLEKIKMSDSADFSLERLFVKPLFIKQPDKFVLNISDIMLYISALEKEVSFSRNVPYDFHYDIEDLLVEPNIYAELYYLSRPKVEDPIAIDYNSVTKILSIDKSESTWLRLLESFNLIQKDFIHTTKYKLNYTLLSEVEKAFPQTIFYKTWDISLSEGAMIQKVLESRNVLFGLAKQRSEFINSMANELLAYIPLPTSSKDLLILGVVTNDRELMRYYRDITEKNNPVFIPRQNFNLPTVGTYRLVILKDFIVVDKDDISNIMPNNVFSHLLYSDKTTGTLPLLNKLIRNFRSYSFHKHNAYTMTRRLNITVEMLLDYSLRIYDNNLSYSRISDKEKAKITFYKNYRNWVDSYESNIIKHIQDYERALLHYEKNDRAFFYHTPTLTNEQQLYFLLFLLRQKSSQDSIMPIELLEQEILQYKQLYTDNSAFSNQPFILAAFSLLNKAQDLSDKKVLSTLRQYIYRLQDYLKSINIIIGPVIQKPIESVPPNTPLPTLPRLIKVVSWNVNSIVKRLSSFKAFVKEANPDIILLQEIRCTVKNFPQEILNSSDYNIVLNCNDKGSKGVAILSKYPITYVSFNLPGNFTRKGKIMYSARYLEATLTINKKKIIVASIYAPQGGKSVKDNIKMKSKLRFFTLLKNRFTQLKPHKNFLLLGGDYNIDPEFNKRSSKIGCSKEEQDIFAEMLKPGLLKAKNLSNKTFTNKRLDLDHFLISANRASKLSKVKKYRKDKTYSNKAAHFPISCHINMKLEDISIPKENKRFYIVDENNIAIERKIIS